VAAEKAAETSEEQGSYGVGVILESTISGSCLACRKETVGLLAVRQPQMCGLTCHFWQTQAGLGVLVHVFGVVFPFEMRRFESMSNPD
jgi:hypothetical protein